MRMRRPSRLTSLSEYVLERAVRAIDAGILWRLGSADFEIPAYPDLTASDPTAFWRDSAVLRPEDVTVVRELSVGLRGQRVVDIEGPSHGPGDHPGSRKLIARARLQPSEAGVRPVVLQLHGFAVPIPLYEMAIARALSAAGAHVVRLDLPFHLRRRRPQQHSGDGFFSADPQRIRAVVRQGVEDAAAIVRWAQAQLGAPVSVLGISLGGLIACLLGAQVELNGLVAVAPFVDPPLVLSENLPPIARRRLAGAGGAGWGTDLRTVHRTLDAALAPLVPARLGTPRTPADRITLVAARHDLIVGAEPVRQLALDWGCELWDYRHGHISIMNARGLATRLQERLLRPPASPWVPSERLAG